MTYQDTRLFESAIKMMHEALQLLQLGFNTKVIPSVAQCCRERSALTALSVLLNN